MIKWWNGTFASPSVVFAIVGVDERSEHWSRGYPFQLVDFLWEYGGRRRDYCTWAGLNIPDRCPQLPGAWKMSWNEG